MGNIFNLEVSPQMQLFTWSLNLLHFFFCHIWRWYCLVYFFQREIIHCLLWLFLLGDVAGGYYYYLFTIAAEVPGQGVISCNLGFCLVLAAQFIFLIPHGPRVWVWPYMAEIVLCFARAWFFLKKMPKWFWAILKRLGGGGQVRWDWHRGFPEPEGISPRGRARQPAFFSPARNS